MTIIVQALYEYSYHASDGRTVSFDVGEYFVLLEKSNQDWWHVQKHGEKPMYVPATYVQEIGELDPDILSADYPSTPDSGDSMSSENPPRSSGSTGDEDFYNHDPLRSPVIDQRDQYKEYEIRLREGNRRDPSKVKSQSLPHGWRTSYDPTGRKVYINASTNETSFKPPRASMVLDYHISPTSQSFSSLPRGWTLEQNDSEPVYLHEATGQRWQETVAEDTGKSYYFRIDGTEADTAWDLPELDKSPMMRRRSFDTSKVRLRAQSPNFELRASRSQSAIIPNYPAQFQEPTSPGNVPLRVNMFAPIDDDECQSPGADMNSTTESDDEDLPLPPSRDTLKRLGIDQAIEMEGTINWKKLVDVGGKRAKKQSWMPVHGRLYSSNMAFFKDPKRIGQTSSNVRGSCDLRNAIIEWAPPNTSKKKNVFQITTIDGMKFLLQHDDSGVSNAFYNAVLGVIRRLKEEERRRGEISARRVYQHTSPSSLMPAEPTSQRGFKTRQSYKVRANSDERTRIREKLIKFFSKNRPSVEELKNKGIIKDSVFGTHISKLCEKENSTIPSFVVNCIQAIERKGLLVDGIYRVCGNASLVNKLRISVDQEDDVALGQPPYEDIHVLTGALKQFFRELPEPLFPFDFFDSFVQSIQQNKKSDTFRAMKNLVSRLPTPNHDTLKYLLGHLRRVQENSDQNRMHSQNLAIVFGPTLMWPKFETGNIAVNMVHQTQIVEFLLETYDDFFT